MLMTECFADALVVFAGKAVSVALDSSLSTAVQAHPALQEEAAGEHDEHGAPTTPHAVFVAECAEDTLKGVGLAAVLVYWLLLSGAIVALLELVRRRSRLLLGWQARWQSVRVLLTLALLVEVVGWTTISTTRALRSEYMRAHAKQGAREASEGTPNAVLVCCLGVVALGSEPEAPLAGALDLVGAVLTMLSAFATARVASLYFHLFFDNGDIDANSSIEEAAENGYYTVGRLYAALAALGFTLWFTARQFHGILQTTDAPEREGAGGVRRLT
eukprot:g6937.t1